MAQLVSEREARDRREVIGHLEIFSPTLSHELKNPIAQEAVTQLGGRMWLDSEPGLGTTFHVAVPAVTSDSTR